MHYTKEAYEASLQACKPGGNEKDTKSTFLLMSKVTKSLSEMIKSENQNFQGPCGFTRT